MAEGFEGVLGADRVLRPKGATLDGAAISAVLKPATAVEVAACLGTARAHGCAVVARGSGSKLGLGNPPASEQVVLLDMSGLIAPLEVDADEGIAHAGAGVRVADLERAAGAVGKSTLFDTALPAATVGGAIAADPIGADCSLDRRLRNDLLGLEVALPDGTVTKCGGQVVKNVTGFDLVRLYCGSLGTLGVITRATLRVRPLPEQRRVLALEYASLEEAHAAARRLELERIEPRGAVIAPSDAGARLVWLLEGGAADVTARADRVPGEAVDPSEWDRQRAVVAGADASDSGAVRVRLGARASDTLELVTAVADLAGTRALEAALPRAGIAFASVSESALVALWERAAARHWLLLIERAPTDIKRRHDAFGPASESLSLMRVLKRRFDPDAVLAPGRFCGGI